MNLFTTTLKRAASVAVLACMGFATGAMAGTISTSGLNGPASINTGDLALFSGIINLTPSAGAFTDSLQNIYLSFNTSDGQSATQSFSGVGGNSFAFNFGVSFATAGNYFVNMGATATDVAGFHHYVTVITGTYSCGFFGMSTCYNYGTVDRPYYIQSTSSTNSRTSILVASATNVPEPASLLLFALGLGVMVFSIYRKSAASSMA